MKKKTDEVLVKTRTNNLRIYYVEKADEQEDVKYNYKQFAIFLGLPPTTIRGYLSGQNLGRKETCQKIEMAMNKPSGDMDVHRPDIKWPVISKYWHHPHRENSRRYTAEEFLSAMTSLLDPLLTVENIKGVLEGVRKNKI